MALKPILFNTAMVRAILNGTKTQTRRICKGQPQDGITSPEALGYEPPYHAGDTLWVRETWHGLKTGNEKFGHHKTFWYRADEKEENPDDKWRPSIHMPKEAARLFLRVEAVRCEQLLNIEIDDALAEGINRDGIITTEGPIAYRVWNRMQALWDSTIKPVDIPHYGWDANPWVWVIEFERIDRKDVGAWP